MAKKLKIHAIGTEDTIIGFGLIGINGTVTTSPEKAKERLMELANSTEYDVLIINSKLLQGLEEFIDDYRLNPENPILVDIPDESGGITHRPIKETLKRAVGL
ncbi:MAG: V-type ATP synthase subunit F [Candidatus Helarchaeota archaeon]